MEINGDGRDKEGRNAGLSPGRWPVDIKISVSQRGSLDLPPRLGRLVIGDPAGEPDLLSLWNKLLSMASLACERPQQQQVGRFSVVYSERNHRLPDWTNQNIRLPGAFLYFRWRARTHARARASTCLADCDVFQPEFSQLVR